MSNVCQLLLVVAVGAGSAVAGPTSRTVTGVKSIAAAEPSKMSPPRQKLRAKPTTLDFVSEVEFLDDKGRVKKRIVQGEGKITHVRVLAGGRFVAVNEDGQAIEESPRNAGGGALVSRGMVLHFYDADGRKLWGLDLCCPMSTRVGKMSEDGGSIVIADVGPDESCELYEAAGGAPTCWGLRVLSWDGKVLFRDRAGPHHGEVHISPHGRYLIAEYVTYANRSIGETRNKYWWVRIDVRRGTKTPIPPAPDGRTPYFPLDDGSVVFPGSTDEGIPPLIWTPEKGIREQEKSH